MNKQNALALIRLWASTEEPSMSTLELTEALNTLQAEGDLNLLLIDDNLLRAHLQGELQNLSIPRDLVSDIQQIIEHHEGLDSAFNDYDELDLLMAESLQAINTPTQLREEILKGSAPVIRGPQSRPIYKRNLKWWSLRISAVAAMAVLFLVSTVYFNRTVEGTSLVEVRKTSLDFLSSGFFLDLKDQEQAHLFNWLKEKDLPSVKDLPQGLQNAQGFGCKKLYFNGETEQHATLLCLRLANDDLVHLIIYKRADASPLAEEFGTLSSAKERVREYHERKWVATEWNTSEMNCLLISPTDEQNFLALF